MKNLHRLLGETYIVVETTSFCEVTFSAISADNISDFVTHIIDTVYEGITSFIANKHKSLSYTAKHQTPVGLYINEEGNIKYQFSTTVVLHHGHVIKFTPTGPGYSLYTRPNSTTNRELETYPSSGPYNGNNQFNHGTCSKKYYLELL